MRVLSARDLASLLTPVECIETIRDVFVQLANQRFYSPLRSRARPEGESANGMTLMPTLRLDGPRRWSLKEMVVTPANSRKGLDPLQGVVILHDGDDGRVLAIADAPELTAIRTAATSALATRTLARPDARTVTVLGTGVQGRMHLQALRAVLPDATLRVWGRSPDKAQQLAEEAGALAFDSIAAAVEGADVVCTVTAAHDPILRREWIAPGCHITAVGSSTPTACEIDPALLGAATLFVDQRSAALAESGDVLRALDAGTITPDSIVAELGAILCGHHAGRTSPEEITLYKSLGFGALDLATLELALELAERHNLGTRIDW